MSKRLILILALAIVVGFAFTAYAEVQNVKVSGDLLVQGVGRNSFLLTTVDKRDRAILSGVRVRIDADLTDNVATTVRLLNERAWGSEDTAGAASDKSDIDLDLAYVSLKEFLYSPLTLVVGRQELRYGNGLIIGDVDTNATAAATSALPTTMNDLSLRKSFDAVKAVLNYDPVVVDLVYAKIEENTSTANDDVTLMGLNANYALAKDILLEGYLWSRDREWGSTGLDFTTSAPNASGQGERLNTLGARTVYTGIANLMLGLEGAWQFGEHVSDVNLYPDDTARIGTESAKSKVNAYAIQLISNYVMPKVKYTPSLALSYTYLSGDKDKSVSDNYTGWSPMFEDQAGGTIFNKIVGYSNARLFNLGGSMKPMDDVTVKLDWYDIRLVQTFTAAGAGTARYLSGALAGTTIVKGGKRHLADELDLGITYDYTEDVQLGLNAGVFFPGPVYDKVNKKNASQVIGSMKVTF